MSKFVTITLNDPIELHGKSISSLQIKEPTGAMFAEKGEPRIWVHTPDGSGYFVEQTSVLSRYVDACVDHEAGGAVLVRLMGLTDAMQVREAVLSFFTEASHATANLKLARLSST